MLQWKGFGNSSISGEVTKIGGLVFLYHRACMCPCTMARHWYRILRYLYGSWRCGAKRCFHFRALTGWQVSKTNGADDVQFREHLHASAQSSFRMSSVDIVTIVHVHFKQSYCTWRHAGVYFTFIHVFLSFPFNDKSYQLIEGVVFYCPGPL